MSSSPPSFDNEPEHGVLVDAGTLVALLDQADPEHEACVATLKTLRDPLITVWPAFAEAMYLLGRSWRGQKALWSRLETDALALAPLDETDAPRMSAAGMLMTSAGRTFAAMPRSTNQTWPRRGDVIQAARDDRVR